MSAMAETRSRRPRRRFTDEFKQQAVRLVLDEGKSVTAVARELDLVASALGQWVKRAQADRSKGRTGLTTAEREELVRLRKALRIAEEERDILRKIHMGGSPPAKSMKVCSVRERRARSTLTGATSPEKNGPECPVSTSNCLPSS